MSDGSSWVNVRPDGTRLPFVTLRSAGGPHDDRSFMAGAFWAATDSAMRHGTQKFCGVIPTEIVRQVDLSAMAHGYSLTTDPAADGWTRVHLVPNTPEPAEVPG